jgi:hypothetical protein
MNWFIIIISTILSLVEMIGDGLAGEFWDIPNTIFNQIASTMFFVG